MEATASEQTLPIDLNVLEEIAGDDPEFVADLLDTFVRSTGELLGPMRASVMAGDIAAVLRDSHRLKGSSANVGAEVLRARSIELERLSRAGTLEGAAGLLDRIESELERVRVFLSRRQRGL